MNSSYQDWWSRIDRLINRIMTVFFAVLIISQILLLNQTAKNLISRTDKLEGKSVADSQLFIKKGEIEISIESHSSLRPLMFYVNGEKADTNGSRSIKLQVKDSDVVEVGGAGYNDTVILKVTGVSDNIIVPELGKLIYVNNNLVMIDRVRID